MTGDNKNFILAIVLSVIIITGWQYFYAQPMLDKQRHEQAEQQRNAAQQPTAQQPGQQAERPATGETPQLPGAAQAPSTLQPRETVIAQNPRLPIDTPSLSGSINLKGAHLDDLHLKKYRVTVDPGSPTITLLNPSGGENAYFTEQGWVPAAGAVVKTPNAQTVWQVPAGAVLRPDAPVTLTWDNGEGLVFRRIVSVDADYLFTIRQEVENRSGNPVSLYPYARVVRQGIPHVEGIYVIHEGLIGVLSSELQEITYSNLKEDQPPAPIVTTGGWLGITDKYWGVAAIPDQKQAVTGTFRHTHGGGLDIFQADYLGKDATVVPAGQTASYESRLFAGAKVVDTVNRYRDSGIDRFDLMIDWGWFYFITKPMFWLIDHLQKWVGNFGIAILLATVIVKLIFFPLANKSYAAMSVMKKLQPEMMAIKERFADDRMKQQQAMMDLYKKEKVSPLSGCLPVIVQIPVFFALYKVLYVTIEMRHAPFYGWIRDLSAHDPTSLFNLFGLIPWSPPTFLMVGVLPLIMGITMWIQMRLNPTPPDPIQAQIFNLMPIFFTFILAPFPAGLVLYWAWNNLLSILQQSVIMKRHGVDINILQNIRDALPSFGRSKAE
jgi:YidC/Oxa1 family membrane protein insertase